MIQLDKLLSLEGALESFGKPPTEKSLRFSTDTRTIKSGESFIAIEGPTFRPMKFIADLKDAPVVIYEKNDQNDELAQKYKNKNFFIAVNDSVSFLQKVARLISEGFQEKGGKLIAICGSNGKTTTKEMLFHLLNETEGDVHCTQKNNNNHIGVPLTLLQLTPNIRFCVLELGSNHPGEIKTLCDIAQAKYGVTTNIGDTHLEFFQNRKNVFLEEGHLFYALKEIKGDKKFFQNMNDEFLSSLPHEEWSKTYGDDKACDYKIQCSYHDLKIAHKNESLEVRNLKLTGEHNFFNLGVAMMIASSVASRELLEFKSAAEGFSPTSNRSEWTMVGESRIFLDAYNANPSSMRAALKGFKEQVVDDGVELSDCSVVLGDMNELGENAAKFHEELGSYSVELGFEHLYFVGRFSKNYLKGSNGAGRGLESVKSMDENVKNEILGRPRCFIKGSRSLQLESIVDIN